MHHHSCLVQDRSSYSWRTDRLLLPPNAVHTNLSFIERLLYWRAYELRATSDLGKMVDR